MANRRLLLEKIVRRLEKEYGSPRHGNKRNALDELFYIILSTRTRPEVYRSNFSRLKRAFPSWNSLRPRDQKRVEAIIKSNGLARIKAAQIVSIVAILRKRYGRATLAPLRYLPDAEAERILMSLPGVSRKVAKCVLMYSFDRNVLPVDVHVHRLAARLGFDVKKRPDTSQDLIESIVPPRLRYSFHVNAIAHGRARCLKVAPRCDGCPVRFFCTWVQSSGET